MTGEHLDAILKTVQAKAERDGWHVLPEGQTLTLHVAHNGASLTVSRIEAVRTEGELLFTRNPKRELYALVKTDVFAVAVDGGGTTGQPARRAGFG
jgi:hypothetical protein